jgi:amino acid permease
MASQEIQPVPVAEEKGVNFNEKAGRGSDISSDAEKQVVIAAPELKRKLKSRHLQMIAIGLSTPSKFRD